MSERDDIGLLEALGSDLSGAVTVTKGEWEIPGRFQQRRDVERRKLRFSLGGVQMKFSVRRNGNEFVLPPDGTGGTHILKLPEPGKPDLPQNEQAMLAFASRCGIPVPKVELVKAESVRGLPDNFGAFEGFGYIIERFDRTKSGRIHVEDFAQITRVHPEEKYERTSFDNIMQICFSVLGEEGLAEFVRRLTFSIAIANADMHLKNWSVIYPDKYDADLAPAYDYVCTAAYTGYDDFLALPLAGTLRWEGIRVETFLRAARNARVDPHVVRMAVDQMKAAIEAEWPKASRSVPKAIRNIVERQLSMPLFS